MHLFALSASIDISIFDGLYTIAKVYEKGSCLGTRSPEKEIIDCFAYNIML
jgi:hypothetical protein